MWAFYKSRSTTVHRSCMGVRRGNGTLASAIHSSLSHSRHSSNWASAELLTGLNDGLAARQLRRLTAPLVADNCKRLSRVGGSSGGTLIYTHGQHVPPDIDIDDWPAFPRPPRGVFNYFTPETEIKRRKIKPATHSFHISLLGIISFFLISDWPFRSCTRGRRRTVPTAGSLDEMNVKRKYEVICSFSLSQSVRPLGREARYYEMLAIRHPMHGAVLWVTFTLPLEWVPLPPHIIMKSIIEQKCGREKEFILCNKHTHARRRLVSLPIAPFFILISSSSYTKNSLFVVGCRVFMYGSDQQNDAVIIIVVAIVWPNEWYHLSTLSLNYRCVKSHLGSLSIMTTSRD